MTLTIEQMKWFLIGAGAAEDPRDLRDGAPFGINVNDIFGPCADMEDVPDSKVEVLFDIFEAFGKRGVIAWVCVQRDALPWREQTREWVEGVHQKVRDYLKANA